MIALVQLGRIGDAVLTLPLLGTIRKHHVGVPIVCYCRPNTAEIFAALGESVLVESIPYGPLTIPRLATRLMRQRPESMVDTNDLPSGTSRLLARLPLTGRHIAHSNNATAGRRTCIYGEKGIAGEHYAYVLLHTLPCLGDSRDASSEHLAGQIEFPTLDVPNAITGEIDPKILPGSILLNISAGSPTRYWSEEKWCELATELREDDRQICILSHPADRSIALNIAGRSDASLIQTPSLLHVWSAVRKAALLISPDTSLVHIASATGTPTVGLYPEDRCNATRFAPLAEGSITIRSASRSDLSSIKAKDVLDAVGQLGPTAP